MTVKAKAITLSIGAVVASSCSTVAYFEGLVPYTYKDPANILTICYGHTGKDVVAGRVASFGECKELLNSDLWRTWVGVRTCIRQEVYIHEAAAITSFAFNVGVHAACSSTMMRLLNDGKPAAVWCNQLHRWTYTTILGVKVQLNGLVKRRIAENKLCLGELNETSG